MTNWRGDLDGATAGPRPAAAAPARAFVAPERYGRVAVYLASAGDFCGRLVVYLPVAGRLLLVTDCLSSRRVLHTACCKQTVSGHGACCAVPAVRRS